MLLHAKWGVAEKEKVWSMKEVWLIPVDGGGVRLGEDGQLSWAGHCRNASCRLMTESETEEERENRGAMLYTMISNL